ncbi:hypothetical protein ALQ26_02929 [Pseudomonas amygdali pv. lachrymans]|nr:hypothetical protein ALQ26_02929 [Pseudomonas amygdali pv. lachrymans]
MCPESSTPGTSRGPVLANRLAFLPVSSLTINDSMPLLVSSSRTYSISAMFGSDDTVSKAIRRLRISRARGLMRLYSLVR